MLHVLRHALWLLLAVAALFFITHSLRVTPCWGVFLLLCLVCWPVWRYRIEYRLFRRRLVLDGVMQASSLFRRLLWKGNLTRGFEVILSLCLAWLLLLLASQLSPLHWWVLVADAVFLALLYVPVARGVSASIHPQHVGAIMRRWPLFLINGIVLASVFMLLDFAVVGAPDTRQLAWNLLVEQTYREVYTQTHCQLWGASAAIAAALEALAWHGSQLLIPNLPDTAARVIGWAFFLLRAATVAWLFTALLLGVSIVRERRLMKQQGKASTLSRAFLVTILLLALPFFYASLVLEQLDPDDFAPGDQDVTVLKDPCKPSVAQRQRLQEKLDREVAARREQAVQALDKEVDDQLDGLFADVEQGVDRYLDWYFTVLGEYQRLAAVFTADVAQTMREQLEKYLFVDTGFDPRLVRLDSRLKQLTTGQFAELAPLLRQQLETVDCRIGELTLAPLAELDHDTLRASVAATSGVGAGIVASKMLAGKTTAAVAGKVAAKKSFQTGAALAGKTLAKKGSSTLLSAGAGTLLCAPTGPLAVLCGVSAGLITWFTVDKALVELDEVLNREEMRAEILAVLHEQQALLAEQLRQKHYASVDQMSSHVNAALQKTFLPASDGLRRKTAKE
ncbi:MAG: hypothetical protein LJE75_10900 [Gammaproteobacteria bacterium]|jgi:Ca2+/Na+ antiporter|nr:hypothetical protein [Gammaproteobacteria bacterium]